MIDLTQKQTVILKHLNNVSNREIARQMHMSKDTVNKYVKEYDEKRNELLSMNPELEQSEIIQAFVEKPKYDSHNRGPLKKTEDAMLIIEECLKLNEIRRARGLHKHWDSRLTARVRSRQRHSAPSSVLLPVLFPVNP